MTEPTIPNLATRAPKFRRARLLPPTASARVLARGAWRAALACVALLSGCNYSFRGGSFPDHIRTLAILPFENETSMFEITQEIHQFLLREVPRGLGVNPGGEENADAILRGTISRYTLETPLYRAGEDRRGPEVLQRQVSISLDVELIDVVNNEILWENAGLSARGQFLEASETEDVAREEAIERIAQMIVDGAQSTW